MLATIFVLAYGFVCVCHGQNTVSCLSCTRLADPEDCNVKIQCLQGEVCMTERYVTEQGHVFYDLGCKLASTCSKAGYTVSKTELDQRIKNHIQSQGLNKAALVGRKRQDAFESGVVHTCQECCETEHCNNYLCGGHVSTNLKCVSCQGVASMSYCDKLETCRPHEVCYIQEVVTDRFELEYNGGCMREVQCQAFLANIKMFYGGQTSPCANCCNGSFCNNYCPVTATTTTTMVTTTTTTTMAPTTEMVSTVCPPFPVPTVKEPTKINNTLVQLGCGKKEDIMFLVDNSFSIVNEEEYYFEVFAQALIESMDISPDTANIGYSYFSGDVRHAIDLNLGVTHSYVDEELKRLESHRGPGNNDTDLADALLETYFRLTGAQGRSDASKTIVLMLKEYNTNTTTLQSITKRLHSKNVTVVVVAVGRFSQDEIDELNNLATPSNYFNFQNFELMKRILEEIALSQCKDHKVDFSLLPDPCSGPKLLNYLGCGAEEDIVMLLDRSGSITSADWKQIHKFVHDMVAKFNIAPDASRLGLISFNDNVTELIQLHEFPKKSDLLNRIDILLDSKEQQPTGETMTGDALQKTIEWYKNSNRTDAVKTAIVFTDGGSDTKFATVARALELHRMNVSVFVIGIGNDVDLKEQLIIASDPDNEHMINVKDVNGLLKYLTYLEAIRCRDLTMQSTLTTSSSTPSATFAALPPIG